MITVRERVAEPGSAPLCGQQAPPKNRSLVVLQRIGEMPDAEIMAGELRDAFPPLGSGGGGDRGGNDHHRDPWDDDDDDDDDDVEEADDVIDESHFLPHPSDPVEWVLACLGRSKGSAPPVLCYSDTPKEPV